MVEKFHEAPLCDDPECAFCNDRFYGLKFTHWKFTGKPISREEMAKRNASYFKPIGMWLSVNGSWERWLDGNWEEWYNDHQDCYEVVIDQDINLFIIESKEQFLQEFRILTGENYPKFGLSNPSLLLKFHAMLIMKYDGIWLKSEPFYHSRLDMEFDYFYSWDCESICIWRDDLVKIEKVDTKKICQFCGHKSDVECQCEEVK